MSTLQTAVRVIIGPTVINFVDVEVPDMKVRRIQRGFRQESMTGNVSHFYVGTPRYSFEITFAMVYGGSTGTLAKLSTIYDYGAVFEFYPFRITSPLSFYDCIWVSESPFEEQFILGREKAMWTSTITWEESRNVPCVAAGDEGPGKQEGEWYPYIEEPVGSPFGSPGE